MSEGLTFWVMPSELISPYTKVASIAARRKIPVVRYTRLLTLLCRLNFAGAPALACILHVQFDCTSCMLLQANDSVLGLQPGTSFW
jgi:hypothetical protein